MGALKSHVSRGIVGAAALALALFASACFNPSETDGVVACGEGETCPPGFACRAADQRCYRDVPPGEVDGAPVDVDGAPGEPDGAPGEPDGAPGEPDGAPIDIDGAPIDIDGAPDDPDASVPPDAGEDAGGGDEATEFCETYEFVCGFAGNPNRYNNFDACVSAYESFDEDRQACVQAELEQAEQTSGSTRNAHCSAAAGNAPCD
jgi:hypothetical protein